MYYRYYIPVSTACYCRLQDYCDDEAHSLHIPNLPQILMFFYQNDILDEEVITTWCNKLPGGAMKAEVS